jgi:hypothetical protein
MPPLGERRGSRQNPAVMSAPHSVVAYTDVELRSVLPSGWGIVPGQTGKWNSIAARWAVQVYDGADNSWQIEVPSAEAMELGRLEALKARVRRLEHQALGRKSIISG